MPVYVYVDTNVFLEYRDLTEWDWLCLTGSTDVEIVVARPVLHELDKIKNSPKRRLRNRARRAIQLIKTGADGLRIRTEVSHPSIDWERTGLRRDHHDDALVAAALANAGSTIVFASGDIAATLIAEAHGIKTLAIGEYELPPVRSEDQEKIAALETELAILRRTMPEFKCGWAKEEIGAPLHIIIPAPTPENIESKLRRAETSLMHGCEDRAALFEHGARIEQYLRDYQGYLEQRARWRKYERHVVRRHVKLHNIGTVLAEDVDVTFAWYGGMASTVPPRPIPPERPHLPWHSRGAPPTAHETTITPSGPLSEARYGTTDDMRASVQYEIKSLKHGHVIAVHEFEFDLNADPIQDLEIEYVVRARNHPTATRGMLRVRSTDASVAQDSRSRRQ